MQQDHQLRNEKATLLVISFDFHGDFDDWVVVGAVPEQVAIFFSQGVRKHDVLPVVSRPSLFGVLVDLVCAAVHGDVEQFTIVVAIAAATVFNVAL